MKAKHYDRRQFVVTMAKAIGTSALLMSPGVTTGCQVPDPDNFTVGDIIDLILKEIPGAPFRDTVDTLKSGSMDQRVTGIISTTFATLSIIQKAIDTNVNFIIVHEPTFYSHTDEVDWLKDDRVYTFKRDLLARHKIAVWRFHDYWHSHRPDGIQLGVLKTLGWEAYADKNDMRILQLPSTTLLKLAQHAKTKLGIQHLRVVGDLTQSCTRIALLPGASGGKSHIDAVEKINPDVLVVGEVHEWETSEYIRDAQLAGRKTSLIVLGHAVSEEPGMVSLVEWLRPQIPAITITHVPAGNPFVFV